jgi:predicted ATP-dependent endonuclease of OLD family
MKLKSLEIQTYRSCIKTVFPLQNELTGLIGINGAGKSNILNAILLLRKICSTGSYMRHEKDPSFNHCRIKAEIVDKEKSIFMDGKIYFATDERNNDDVQFSNIKWKLHQKWLNIPTEIIAYREQFKHAGDRSDADYRRIMRQRWFYLKKRTQPLLSDNDHQILAEIANFFNGISYYSASQFSDPSRSPVSIELEENRPLRRPRSFAGHDQFILDLYKSFKEKNKQYKRYLSTVNQEGIGLIDDISFNEVDMPSNSYEVQSGGKIRTIERNRLLIVPSFSVDGSKLSPNQLSEGTFKTLALLFYILTDESKLLLIEEPEVCIHHGLLSSIISLIKSQSKQKQIVISTHSDFVLDHLAPENLVLVKRQPDKGTVATQLSKTMSKNDFKVLRDYLEESGNLGEYWREGGLDNE